VREQTEPLTEDVLGRDSRPDPEERRLLREPSVERVARHPSRHPDISVPNCIRGVTEPHFVRDNLRYRCLFRTAPTPLIARNPDIRELPEPVPKGVEKVHS
jgi:hypothetical protein